MQTNPKSEQSRNRAGRRLRRRLWRRTEETRKKGDTQARWIHSLPLHIQLFMGHDCRYSSAGLHNIGPSKYLSPYTQNKKVFLFFLLLLTRKGLSFPSRKNTNICKARFCFSIYYYIYFNSSYRSQYSFIQRASLFHICGITKKFIYLSARHWPSYMT